MPRTAKPPTPGTLMTLERCPFCGTDQLEDVTLDEQPPAIGQTRCLNCGSAGPFKEVALSRGAFCHPFTWLPLRDWERIHDIDVTSERLGVFAGRRK